jgi:hypothetical protein
MMPAEHQDGSEAATFSTLAEARVDETPEPWRSSA